MAKGCLPQFLRWKPENKQKLLEGPVVNYDAIYEKCCNRNSSGDLFQLFLPESAVKSLVTEGQVISTLRQNAAIGRSKDVNALASYFVKDARKTFLTMVYSGTSQYAWLLYEANFTDDSLPVTKHTSEAADGNRLWLEPFPPRGNGEAPQGLAAKTRHFSDTWSKKECNDFYQHQWMFRAPVFRADTFEYSLEPDVPLPYIPSYRFSEPGAGHFSTVQKVGLLNDHHDLHGQLGIIPSEKHVDVALKILTVQGSASTTDIERFYDKEKNTLKEMRDLNHPHLIRAVAAYQRGYSRCFIFPWAEGGDLRSLWRKDATRLDGNLILWALGQMEGITGGILELHRKKMRHGDLKPENILRFMSTRAPDDLGTLVVADVGLTKYHPEYTRERNIATTTRHGSRMYEPPDVLTTNPTSRRYDVWSLGCVFLEFVIWLLYGYGGPFGLRALHEELVKDASIDRFWKNDPVTGLQVHPVVLDWIENKLLKEIPAGCPLRDLVSYIGSKLLLQVNERPYSKDVHNELKEIEKSWTAHNFESCCSRFAQERNRRLASEGLIDDPAVHLSKQTNLMSRCATPYKESRKFGVKGLQACTPRDTNVAKRTTNLSDKWENITDRQLATTVLTSLDWNYLRPSSETLIVSPCSTCVSINFESPEPVTSKSLAELKHGSKLCNICGFLAKCVSEIKPPVQGPVNLVVDTASHSLRLPGGGPEVVTIYSDPASEIQPAWAQIGLPLLPDMASPEQLSLVNEWVRICNDTHDCVSDKEGATFKPTPPTRLIDLGTGPKPTIRLIETANRPDLSGVYIALSHRWGQVSEQQKFCTLKSNIGALKKNIPYKSLPKNFQDAVRVTRALGVSYLWIDSLCIIQDDGKDWENEAGKMEDVFASSYVTIAATSATSSVAGFLGGRHARPCITVRTPKGYLYLSQAIDDFRTDVEKGVLNTRGWVFQERALSRRTVHFTSNQLYWECGKGIHCETLAQLRNSQTQFLGDSHFPDYGLQFYKDERIRLVQYLYQLYCDLDLTVITDRPKAILGLEKRLARSFKSRSDYGVLWSYFERMLLWRAEFPGVLSRIPDTKTAKAAPSWSWMSRAGRIRFLGVPFSTVSWEGNLKNPFADGADNDAWDGSLSATANRLLLDAKDAGRWIVPDGNGDQYDQATWLCVVLGKAKASEEETMKAHYVLLIRPSSSEKPQAYERAGVGVLYDSHVSQETASISII